MFPLNNLFQKTFPTQPQSWIEEPDSLFPVGLRKDLKNGQPGLFDNLLISSSTRGGKKEMHKITKYREFETGLLQKKPKKKRLTPRATQTRGLAEEK